MSVFRPWLFPPLLLYLVVLIGRTLTQGVVEGVIKIIMEGENQSLTEPRDMPYLLPEYDFIVVGAGTAGCVVANRLSENPEWNVLLIEAGGTENFLMDLPLLANYLQFTDSNWKYKTVPSDRYCLGLDNNQCNYPRGKVMGGSSVLNYMIYTRGNHRDYDNWAKMGNQGWSYLEVLPYFKKVENFTIPELFDGYYHGKDGYLSVGFPPYRTKVADAVLQAGVQMGLDLIDYNGKYQIGMSQLQVSMRDGVRDSSSRAYLHPIRHRPNLHVKKLSTVSRVLIDPTTKQTYGIEFVRNHQKYVIRTKREVILSAGAINSPQLLMLSGIGPRKHLKQVNIPVIKNLRVGYNLMDHIASGGYILLIDKPYSLNTQKALTKENLAEYLNYHKGPISIPGGCEILAFLDLEHPGDPDGYPDVELLIQAGSIVSEPLLKKDFGVKDTLYDYLYKPIEGHETFMMFPMLLRPKSKGRVMLRDNNYRSKPFIFPNYFADEYDVKTMIGGVRALLNLTQMPALQKLGTRVHQVPLPPCAKHKFLSDPYIECLARHFTLTIYHQSGTCKMGPVGDKRAVVDPRLRVHGIQGLRVIDASIMPEIPAAHTNAPTFMIAEKGAEMIKEDWGWVNPKVNP